MAGHRSEDVLGQLHSVWIVDRIGLLERITLFRTFGEADGAVAW